jgi:hypothetical protein
MMAVLVVKLGLDRLSASVRCGLELILDIAAPQSIEVSRLIVCGRAQAHGF